MEIKELSTELTKIVENFIKNEDYGNPWDLVALALEIISKGIHAYRDVEGLKGTEKKRFVIQAVDEALTPLFALDIPAIPNWIEEPAEDALKNKYIPEYIDKFFEA